MWENEIKNLDIKGYPTIYLYPKNDKSNPIEFLNERNEDYLKQFLIDNL